MLHLGPHIRATVLSLANLPANYLPSADGDAFLVDFSILLRAESD